MNGDLSLAIEGFFLCPLFPPSLGCPSVYYKKNSLAVLEVVKVLSSVLQEDVGEGPPTSLMQSWLVSKISDAIENV